MNAIDLTSIAGIVVATIAIVQAIKGTLGNARFFRAIPIWFYVAAVAGGLTFLANRIMGSLAGDFWQLLGQSILNALAATGTYEWVRNLVSPMGQCTAAVDADLDRKTQMPWLVILLLIGSLAVVNAGCTSGATPLGRAMAARELYTSTLNVLSVARETGKIDDESYRQIEIVRAEVARELDLLEAAAIAGKTGEYSSILAMVNSSMDRLLEWRIGVEGKK